MSDENNGENTSAASSEATDPLKGLAKSLTKSKLPWLRSLGAVMLLVIAALPYVDKILEFADNRELTAKMRTANAPVKNPDYYSDGKGTPISAPKDAPAESANALSADDAAHLSFHVTARMESPGFKRIPVPRGEEEIAYAVFPSDGCILINHIRGNGHIKSDLVRADEPSHAIPADSPTVPKNSPTVYRYLQRPSNKLDVAWNFHRTLTIPDQNITPIQGSCLNPHPGQFQFWSTPVNQCLEQVFRRFADGCTHYQMHDRCTNNWEPGVHWTFCNGQHSW